MYLYLKAIHIIFIVTWFAGLFYIVRLFIYNAEANEKPEPERSILQKQFTLMSKRLWFGITWPSAVLTLMFGLYLLFDSNLYRLLFTEGGKWLTVKLIFVLGLYLYHFSLHYLFLQQSKGMFRYGSRQLRIWNEVATLFLVSIVILVSVKQSMSWLWGLVGLVALIIVLMTAIRIYQAIRK